ncbi:hypothetical protein LTR53_003117 [Teratosphaeriaceae sp. CCFEE 6253]|nr:hypothetical protein LTR53_003117 [Teratosphaeriaceae sp. CCFEE 6253]
MAPSLEAWLATFIAAELDAVIAWHGASKQKTALKQEPEDRFSDDGSNFRSTAGPPSLTTSGKVQILGVISSEKPVILLVSDGSYSIRASVSDSARAILEREIDEKLSPETIGDVVSLSTVTVISTPYGLPEGLVQLDIEELQYQYHLRRKAEESQPIEWEERVSQRLGTIKQIRKAQYENGDDEAADGPAFRSVPSPQGKVRRADTQTVGTQEPARKKRAMASLKGQGFEIEAGVNLARPAAAPKDAAPQTRPPKGLLQATSGDKGPFLLDLLGGPRATTMEGVHVAQATSAALSPTRRQPSAPAPSIKDVAPAPQTLQSATPRNGERVPYGRRPIPELQQRLLDRKDSWFPPMPGNQLPFPNVPVELLSSWAPQTAASGTQHSHSMSTPIKASQASAEASASASKVTITINTSESSESPFEESSEEEELTSTQWPESPTAKRCSLPPDSTIGSHATNELVSPQKLPLRSPAKTKNARSASTTDGTPSRPLSAHMRPSPKASPASIAATGPPSGGLSQQHPKKSPFISTLASSRAASERQQPMPASASPSRALLAQATSTINGASPRPRSANMQQPVQTDGRQSLSTKESPQSNGKETIIKGTQFSGDEMELDVPRPLPDPMLSHQQRRTKHMRDAQRRDWLKANYRYTEEAAGYRAEVHSHYLETYPKDLVRRSEFLHAMKEVFPELDQEPYGSLRQVVEARLPALRTTPIVKHAPKPVSSSASKPATASKPASVAKPEDARLVRRREWLKANCIYNYDAGPYTPHFDKLFAWYKTTYPGDRFDAAELNEDLKKVFPVLYTKPANGVKLKPTALPPKAVSRHQQPTTPAKPVNSAGPKPRTMPSRPAPPAPIANQVRKIGNFDGTQEADEQLSDERAPTGRAATSEPQPAPANGPGPALTAESPRLLPASAAAHSAAPSSVVPSHVSGSVQARTVQPGSPSAVKFGTSYAKLSEDPQFPDIAHATSGGRAIDTAQIVKSVNGIARSQRKQVISLHNGRPLSQVATNPPHSGAQSIPGTRPNEPALKTTQPRASRPGDRARLHHEAQDKDTTPLAPITVFDDFMRAWQNVRPGGAFAQDTSTGDRSARRDIDVLAWAV